MSSLNIVEIKPLRVCRVCGKKAFTNDDLNLFTKHKDRPYGRMTICKECWNKQKLVANEKYRLERRRKNREYMKHYYPEHREARIEYGRKRDQLHPKIRKAQRKAEQLPLAESCELCDSTEHRLERHHLDYDNPEIFVTLCTPCHRQAHLEVS